MRSDAVEHGSITMYRYGCRCRPCCYEESCYQRDLREGNLRRVPVADVIADIDRLKAAGWSYQQIIRDCGLSNSTLWSIRNTQTHVNSRTAEAIADLASVLDEDEVRFPVESLVELVEGRGLSVKGTFNENDRRAYYRAVEQGYLTETMADRLITGVLGKPLPLVYPEHHMEEAA